MTTWKINRLKLIKIWILMIAVCTVICGWGSTNAANAATPKIKVSHSSKTSKNVKFTITGENITSVDITDFFYGENEKSISKSKVKIKYVNSGKVELSYTCKSGEVGQYYLFADVYCNDEFEETVYGNFTFNDGKAKNSVKISKAPKSCYIPGVGKFTSYYKIDKKGSEQHVKPGETVTVDVLYRSTNKKGIKSNNVYLKWGSQTIKGKVTAQGEIDTDGYYNFGARFKVTTSGDHDGKLVAYYSGTKNTSRSLGVTIDSDGTKPVIKIDSQYQGGKTKYFNKDVSVPVTIQEKNFDQSKTTVTVNGRTVSASWSGGGDSHQAKIKLKEGKNVVEVVSTDKAGNKSDVAKSATIIVDKKDPKVKIEGFENGTGKGLKNGEVVPYPFKVTISDETKLGNQKVELCRLSDDGKNKEKIPLKTTADGNKIIYSVDNLETDGYYTLEIVAKDKAGNKPTSKTVKSEGKKPYEVSKGKIKGGFTVNRAGSMYKPENEKLFDTPVKESGDIVIYEYNKNEIISQTVEIVDSVTTRVLTASDYDFEKMPKSDEAKYKYQYKYTIHQSNFVEGYYDIQISSTSIAGKNGTLIAQTEETNSLNKRVIVDKTPPEIILFEGTTGGDITLKLRDENMDAATVEIQINGKKYALKKNDDESTSTNIVYEGDINVNPKEAQVVCQDMAGNITKGGEIVIKKDSVLKTVLVYGGLAVGAIILIAGAVITLVLIKKKK